jgi:hypothetical protein
VRRAQLKEPIDQIKGLGLVSRALDSNTIAHGTSGFSIQQIAEIVLFLAMYAFPVTCVSVIFTFMAVAILFLTQSIWRCPDQDFFHVFGNNKMFLIAITSVFNCGTYFCIAIKI